MKVIICNKISETNPEYFKRAWRIPFMELEAIGWLSIDQNEIKGSLVDYFMKKYSVIPTVILFWNTNTFIQNNFEEITKNNWTKCIYMDDLHQSSEKIKSYRNEVLNKFDYVFSTYAYVFRKFYNVVKDNQLIWYPHNINDKFMVDFNNEPINKILLSGSQEPTIYPFRKYMRKLSKKHPIDKLPQLSYRTANHDNYGHNYIKFINKYIAAFTCCSNENTPYIVSKFFEIPASGALLLAFDEYVKEPLKHLGFIDGVNYLSINYANAEEIIKFITNPENKKKIDEIRHNGYELVWSRHKLTDRIKLINDTVTNSVENKN